MSLTSDSSVIIDNNLNSHIAEEHIFKSFFSITDNVLYSWVRKFNIFQKCNKKCIYKYVHINYSLYQHRSVDSWAGETLIEEGTTSNVIKPDGWK